MAAVVADKPVNGNRALYSGAAEPYIAASAGMDSHASATGTAYGEQQAFVTNATSDEGKPPKETIGWFFVESYYNTLSKEPTKLYLYYSKKSQFVAGDEAEKVSVAVGQKKIGERIKELDIKDCKVRVTNVDCQGSGDGILVQVIGEMSNRAAPQRKFTQTFVLAEQPTGYFVLNDIFRYILDDEEDEEESNNNADASNGVASSEAAKTSTASSKAVEPVATIGSKATITQPSDALYVDQKLEDEVLKQSNSDGQAASVAQPLTTAHSQKAPTSEGIVAPPLAGTHEPVTLAVEKPHEPSPTPLSNTPRPETSAGSAAPPASASAAGPASAKPIAPRTWASLVSTKNSAPAAAITAKGAASPTGASAAVAASVSSSTSSKLKTSTSGPQKDSSAAATAGSPGNEEGPNGHYQPSQQSNGNNGWQTAGDNKTKHGRQHSSLFSAEHEKVLAYVKNVTEKVDGHLLKTTLESYGKLVYFDISRTKNCAFVEFADIAAYNAAVAHNPHQLGGENVLVEERRLRSNAYGAGTGGNGIVGARGGRNGGRFTPGDRSSPGAVRNGYANGSNKDSSTRGGYASRGRGGNGNASLPPSTSAALRGRNGHV